MERDPVCGMQVNPGEAAAKREYQGRTYYFCSPDCAKRFDQSPARYAGDPSPPASGGAA